MATESSQDRVSRKPRKSRKGDHSNKTTAKGAYLSDSKTKGDKQVEWETKGEQHSDETGESSPSVSDPAVSHTVHNHRDDDGVSSVPLPSPLSC